MYRKLVGRLVGAAVFVIAGTADATVIGTLELNNSWSVLSGSSMANAKNTLLADGHALVDVGTGNLATNLQSVDIFYLPWNGGASVLNSPQVTVIENWVAGGNRLVVQADHTSYNNLLAVFGATSSASFAGFGSTPVTGSYGPLTNGPFGTVNSINLLASFAISLPPGGVLLDAFASVGAIEGGSGLPNGYGTVVILSDVNMWSQGLLLDDNTTLWRNIFAAQELVGVPEPGIFSLIVMALFSLALLRKRQLFGTRLGAA